MIAAETFLAGRVLPFPASASRIPPAFHAFPAGSRDWNVSAVVVDAGTRMTDGQIVVEIVTDGELKAQPMSLRRARSMVRSLARGIAAAGAEAACVAVDGVTFAMDEAEALRDVLTRAVRRCETERRGGKND